MARTTPIAPATALSAPPRMSPWPLLGLLVFSAACTSGYGPSGAPGSPPAPLSSEEIHENAERSLAALERNRDGEMVWALCENPPRPGRCGTVWDELVRQDKIAAFVKDKCHEDLAGEVSDDCKARFSEAFVALLRRTYPRAVEMDIFKFCESQPDKCETKALVELQWITSHDAHVLSFYSALMDAEVRRHASSQREAAAARRAQAQAEADAAASRQAAARVFRAIGAGLQGASQGMQQNRPVNCTSNRVGSAVFTNCQ